MVSSPGPCALGHSAFAQCDLRRLTLFQVFEFRGRQIGDQRRFGGFCLGYAKFGQSRRAIEME